MKTGSVLLLLLFSVPAFAGEWTPEKVQKYNECFSVLKQVRWIKAMRAQNMETNGPRTLAELERDWEDTSRHLGCYVWQGEFDRRNP
jgi:hypothetical protein